MKCKETRENLLELYLVKQIWSGPSIFHDTWVRFQVRTVSGADEE